MTESRAQALSTVALIGTITIASVLLVLFTDLHVLLRGGLAVVLGVIAAAITFSVARRRARES